MFNPRNFQATRRLIGKQCRRMNNVTNGKMNLGIGTPATNNCLVVAGFVDFQTECFLGLHGDHHS
jgi:hypothetical protein